jgi:hypothetical protein
MRQSEYDGVLGVRRNTLYARIDVWLRDQSGLCFCHSCIASSLEIRNNPNLSSITNRIGVSSGSKYKGKCSLCGKVTTVTSANAGF